jgi:peroxiredoxin
MSSILKFITSSLFIMSFLLFLGFTVSDTKNDSTQYENFSLYDYDNNLHSLKDFTTKKGIVVMFIATQCPVSNEYNSRMAELYEAYKENFSIIGINSNKQEDIEEIKNHAADNALNFIILKDSNNVIADMFEASFTPEVYVLNNNYELLYHGRIDDSRRISGVQVRDLKNALDEIANGSDVTVKKTKAFGCTIKRVN